MSTSLEGESERNELLDDERNKPTKSLGLASAAYVFRFLQHVSRDYVKKKRETETVGSSSYTILNLEPESEFKIDQTTLTKLVEEKNGALLEELGGVSGIAKSLKTNLVHGIIHDEVEDIARRRKTFGANTLQNPPKKSIFQLVRRALLDVNIFILIICGSVSLGLGIKVDGAKEGWNDGGSILIGVFLAIILIVISEFWHNGVFEKLLKHSYNIKIDVVRGGRRHQIPVHEIVVGDVVCLKYGDLVPAHGLIIEAHSLKLEVDKTREKRDEGDNVELTPTKENPFLFSGTKVVDGFAWMLVTSVGMNARRGQMTSRISRDTEELTPLEARLEELDSITDIVGYVVTVVFVLIFATGNLSFTVTDENGVEKPATGLAKIYAIVVAVVGIITSVVNIADPPLLSLKLTRAYAMKKLKAKNVMVGDLSALETMSFVNKICVNKTGTLTMNMMTIKMFWLGDNCMAEETYPSTTPEFKKLLQEGIALNTISGSSTEKAILYWGLQYLEMDMEEIKSSHDILHIEAFSSEKKRSGIITKRKAHNKIQVHLKGASELILKMCSCYYDAFGNVKDLDHNQKMKFEKIIHDMADSGLRCIAFAHKEVEAIELQNEDKAEILKDGMTLLGIVGISDPCRQGVKHAVENLKSAGVEIKMITGDNIFTAKAIARECGILPPDSEAIIDGEEFWNYNQEVRMKKVDEICVLARASPHHKLLMVQCLKKKGHVVAVAGNGTNNSLAMKEAEVGVSMGFQGTKVTAESSDIVISDGNIDSIPEVLKWGRCAYSSVQKFIQFQLTASFSALLSNIIGLFLSQKLTLTAVQLMWVSLITETLSCLAFATEKPTKELMKKTPVCKTDPLVTNIMLRNILPQALFQTVLLLKIQNGILFSSTDDKVLLTFVFTSYVLCQVFNQINSRKLESKNVFEKIHTNKLFLLIAVFIIVLQILLVDILKIIADTKELNWPQWGISTGIAALTLPIGLVARFLPVPKKEVVSHLIVVPRIGRLIVEKLSSVLTWASQVLIIMQRNQHAVEILPTTNPHTE